MAVKRNIHAKKKSVICKTEKYLRDIASLAKHKATIERWEGRLEVIAEQIMGYEVLLQSTRDWVYTEVDPIHAAYAAVALEDISQRIHEHKIEYHELVGDVAELKRLVLAAEEVLMEG